MFSASDPMDTTNLDKMVELAEKLSGQEALGVIRCINAALCLVNSAEVQHRLRGTKTQELEISPEDMKPGPLYSKEDSVKGSIYALLDNKEATPEEIYEQLCTQNVEIVLTAHPTEVNRKSVLRKYRIASELLAYLERTDLLPYEKMQATDDLERIISSLWGMDEIRRNKPTVQKEAAGGLAIIESVLWEAVPAYLRKLDAQCDASVGKRLPLDAVPIKFASWIGGQFTTFICTHSFLPAHLFANKNDDSCFLVLYVKQVIGMETLMSHLGSRKKLFSASDFALLDFS